MNPDLRVLKNNSSNYKAAYKRIEMVGMIEKKSAFPQILLMGNVQR